ncbi:hypothetical protein ACFWP2_20560 [Kitasatospora sp. NPDC058444]|uniref:hypothetical protein n=1 Tax=Kitasatospora sp. NPDC058444 TaxID=3346504 RepID=UPI003655E5D4
MSTTTTAHQIVIDHALLTPTNSHDHVLCAGCWASLGEPVLWPCAPLLDVATVEPIEGGWTIRLVASETTVQTAPAAA